MASHPAIASTCERIAAAGGRPSPSSLESRQIQPAPGQAVPAAENRSVTSRRKRAPSACAGHNKNLTEAEILRAPIWMVRRWRRIAEAVLHVRAADRDERDLDGICELAERMRDRMMGHGRKRGRVGTHHRFAQSVRAEAGGLRSVDPMVPSASRSKIAYIRRRTGRMANVDLDATRRAPGLHADVAQSRPIVACVRHRSARPQRSRMWQELGESRRGKHGGVALDLDAFVHREYRNLRCSRGFNRSPHRRSYLWVNAGVAHSERNRAVAMWPPAAACGAC